MATRLTENHPLTMKLRALEVYMEDEQIKIEYDGYHLNVIDSDTGINAYYKDADTHENAIEIPSLCHSHLIREE